MKEKINIILEMKNRESITSSYEEKLLKEVETLKRAINMDNENLKNMFIERISKGIETLFEEESHIDCSSELNFLLNKRKTDFERINSSEDFISAAINFLENSERTIEYESSKDNPNVIDIPQITYQGVLIENDSKEAIKEYLKKQGIEIKNEEVDMMHVTYQYFEKEDEKAKLLFTPDDINKEITFNCNYYGELIKDGKLANQGLTIDVNRFSNNKLKSYLKKDIPHITLSVNNEKIESTDKKGKPIKIPFSTAKETINATFNIPIDIEVTGKTAYFSPNGVHYRLEENEKQTAINNQINKEIDNYIESTFYSEKERETISKIKENIKNEKNIEI